MYIIVNLMNIQACFTYLHSTRKRNLAGAVQSDHESLKMYTRYYLANWVIRNIKFRLVLF